jgi:hypothetical protein
MLMNLLNGLAWVAFSGLSIVAFGVSAAFDPLIRNGLAAFKRKQPPFPSEPKQSHWGNR